MTSPEPGNPETSSPPEELPVALGSFTLHRLLGEHDGVTSYLAQTTGSMGFAKPVMVKIGGTLGHPRADRGRQLCDEALLGMRLAHPNLLPITDLRRVQGRLLLVREWVDGIGLRSLMARTWQQGESLPAPAVLRIGIGIARAISYLHTRQLPPWAPQGIVHRAVTPSNILLSRWGEVRLANLFMSRPAGRTLSSRELTNSRELIPAYHGPEMSEGEAADPRSDLFSLGSVLFEALVGPTAFAGDSSSDWERSRNDDVVASHLLDHEMPEELRRLLIRSLAPRASQRPSSARQVERQLEAILQDDLGRLGIGELQDLVDRRCDP